MKWGMLSAIIIFISGLSYMWGIHRREIERPVTSTWALWTVITAIIFITSKEAGSNWGTTLLPILMGVINPFIIFCLSLFYGKHKWDKLDTVCVVVCVITIVVWQTTNSPVLGILGGLLADGIAATPMIVKSWKDPKDEPVFPWLMFAFGSAINLLAVEEWVIKFWLFPIYMTATSLMIVYPVILYRIKLQRVSI